MPVLRSPLGEGADPMKIAPDFALITRSFAVFGALSVVLGGCGGLTAAAVEGVGSPPSNSEVAWEPLPGVKRRSEEAPKKKGEPTSTPDGAADIEPADIEPSDGPTPEPIGFTVAPVITQLATGASFTCGLSLGQVLCWGDNTGGALGLGFQDERGPNGRVVGYNPHFLPKIVPNLTGIVQIAASKSQHMCGIKGVDGSVWCWGWNVATQLGAPSEETCHFGMEAAFANDDKLKSDENPDGKKFALGREIKLPCSSTPVRVADLGGRATQLALGEAHSCALMGDKTVRCWGAAAYGLLGPGAVASSCTHGAVTYPCSSVPKTIEGLANVKQLAAGYNHTCAAIGDGTVICWGGNQFGQLGNDFKFEFPYGPGGKGYGWAELETVEGLTDVEEVVAGLAHTCVRKRDGSVWCWGDNSSLQTGQPMGDTESGSIPMQVSARDLQQVETVVDGKLTKKFVDKITKLQAKSLAAGNDRTCAIRTIDDVDSLWCWGNDAHDFLGSLVPVTSYCGDGKPIKYWKIQTVDEHGQPLVDPSGEPLYKVVPDGVDKEGRPKSKIIDRRPYEMAKGEDGKLMPVFWKGPGKPGDDVIGDYYAVPNPEAWKCSAYAIPVPLSDIVEVSMGGSHTCVRTDRMGLGSEALCWGDNYYGQLGVRKTLVRCDGDVPCEPLPVPVRFYYSGEELREPILGKEFKANAAKATEEALKRGAITRANLGRGIAPVK